jgi:hypothetical protein
MRNQKLILLVVGSLFISSFLSCKKVINVSLKNADVQLVINGEVNNRPGPYKISISNSVTFSADNIFPPVSNAIVTITGNGVIDTLSEDEPGIYFTHTIKGEPGKSYSLHVSVEGKTFTAISVMPKPVHIDSLTFVVGENKNLFAVANFQDPPDVENFYQFIEYADDKRFNNGRGNSVFNDRLSDGRYISTVLYDDSTDIKPGVTLTVQMNCIDKPVYNYLQQLLQISGNGGSFSNPSPVNPVSNISGGALGYFSAHTITSKTVKLPE